MRKHIISIGIVLGLAASIWIVCYSYHLNARLFYYDGLLGALLFLWLGRFRWRGNAAFNIPANTLILFIVCLPMADAVFKISVDRAGEALLPGSLEERIYSYETASGNPEQFAVWWNRFLREWDTLSEKIVMKDPERRLPFVLKPGSSGMFFESQIRINSLGFRDRKFEVEKGHRYRIVALGESTTMGLTLTRDGRPWPAVLEEMIAHQLHTPLPIEVINAGVAGYTLRDSLVRLKRDVLRLSPDMIISYHGYNGFHFLDDTMDPEERIDLDAEPPVFVERPSILLAQAEFRLKMHRFRILHFRRNLTEEMFSRRKRRLSNSSYAEMHRELISVARRNGIKLVLLSFNMAVNERRPPDVVNFYRGGFLDVDYRIQANRLQNDLLKELGRQNEDVAVINTADGLDGRHELFFDLIHLTQEGKDKLAENVLKELKPILKEIELPESLD